MNILITGGTGFIGSHLTRKLYEEGHKLRLISPSGRHHRVFEKKFPGLKCLTGDFGDSIFMREALQNQDILVHLAWTTVPRNATANPAFDVESNVVGTLRMLEECINAGVGKVLFISSGGTVYGPPLRLPVDEQHPLNPISSYGISKLTTERYLELFRNLHGLDYVVLRPANVYGEHQNIYKRQGVIGVWLFKILQGETPEIWGDGSVIRDYIHAEDLARAVSLLIPYKGQERIFNVGTGTGHSLNEILEAVRNAVKQEVKVRYSEGRKFDVPKNVLDISRLSTETGWKPQVQLREGIRRTWEWVLSEPD